MTSELSRLKTGTTTNHQDDACTMMMTIKNGNRRGCSCSCLCCIENNLDAGVCVAFHSDAPITCW